MDKFCLSLFWRDKILSEYLMKKIPLLLLGLFLINACGGNSSTNSNIPTGASLIFDAARIGIVSPSPLGVCNVTNLTDSSGSAHNGFLNCAAGGGFAGSGIPSDPNRFVFDGVSTYISTNFNAQPDVMPSSTWVAWIRPVSTAFSEIISIDSHLNAFNRSLIINSTTGQFGVFNPFNQTWLTTAVSPNVWQFIAVVFTPDNLIFYKNGTSLVFGNPPLYTPTSQTLTIGRSAGGSFSFFQGSIAWVAVYPRALSQTEVMSICNELVPRFDTGNCL